MSSKATFFLVYLWILIGLVFFLLGYTSGGAIHLIAAVLALTLALYRRKKEDECK